MPWCLAAGDGPRAHLQRLAECIRWSYGAGIVLRLGNIARLELNYCFPMGVQAGDRLVCYTSFCRGSCTAGCCLRESCALWFCCPYQQRRLGAAFPARFIHLGFTAGLRLCFPSATVHLPWEQLLKYSNSCAAASVLVEKWSLEQLVGCS